MSQQCVKAIYIRVTVLEQLTTICPNRSNYRPQDCAALLMNSLATLVSLSPFRVGD